MSTVEVDRDDLEVVLEYVAIEAVRGVVDEEVEEAVQRLEETVYENE